MEFTPVESSQISAVGYDEGTETLGIRFPAGKRSAASEYHYANVPPRVHRALISAESIGSYFGKNIKSRPDLYPFVKVEADPTAPTVEPLSVKNSAPAFGNDDTPTTSISLAIIDTISDDLLFTPGAVTDAQLAAGREWYLDEAKKYDISTEKSRTELKRFARPLQKLRTGIEARAKEFTGATKRKIATIDAEKRRLVGFVGGVEDEVLSSLTAWEREEEDRKIRLAGISKHLSDLGSYISLSVPTSTIEAAIKELESFDISTMQEFKVGAESAVLASLRVLKPELARRIQAEADAKELERLRAEKAAADEQKRINDAAELLAAKKIEAMQHPAPAEAPLPVPVNTPSPVSVPEVLPAIVEARQTFTTIDTRVQIINADIVNWFRSYGIDRRGAIRLVTDISKGLAPHLTITY